MLSLGHYEFVITGEDRNIDWLLTFSIFTTTTDTLDDEETFSECQYLFVLFGVLTYFAPAAPKRLISRLIVVNEPVCGSMSKNAASNNNQ